MIHIVGPPASLKTSLIELGIKIYEIQHEKKISPLILDPTVYSGDELFGGSDLMNETSESIAPVIRQDSVV